MQFGLVGSKAGDVEHQAPDLQKLSLIVVEAERIDKDVDRRSVFAPQGRFEVTKMALLLHDPRMALALLRERNRAR